MSGIKYKDPSTTNSHLNDVNPRMGSFELYANLGYPQGKVHIVHLFSKKKSGYWPNFDAVANRALRAMAESEQGVSLQELEEKYTTRISMARV